MKTNRITLVRTDKKQQRRVSPITISKLIEKLKSNVSNEDIAMLRYKVKHADQSIYSSLLNVPVAPAGINDGSSPVMANCRISADAMPLLMEKPTPLNVDGVELPPMPQAENIKTGDDNEVGALIAFLSSKYEFRYNSVRGATEYLDKQKPYWGWRLADCVQTDLKQWKEWFRNCAGDISTT